MIQFNPLTFFQTQATAQPAVTYPSLPPPTPDSSSFTALSHPTDLLNGALGGLTVTAAALGSPALARVCSHPLFAGAALMAGAAAQAQALGHVGGLLPGALLFLASVATTVSGYSFYRGFKAGWQALKDSSRLAVYDRVRTLYNGVEVRADREKNTHPVLSEAKKLAAENLVDVKAAIEHFKDLRDEKPQRIEAAYLSGLVNNPEVHGVIAHSLSKAGLDAVAALTTKDGIHRQLPKFMVAASERALAGMDLEDLANADEAAFAEIQKKVNIEIAKTLRNSIGHGLKIEDAKTLLQRMVDASSKALTRARRSGQAIARGERSLLIRERVDEAQQEALAAARKAHLTSRLVPATLSRIREPLEPQTAEEVRCLLKDAMEIERLLETTIQENAVVNRWSALKDASSARGYIRRTTTHAIEAQRVASASPRNWVSEAIGDPTYSPAEKAVGHWLGDKVNLGLRYGVPSVVGLQIVEAGIATYQGRFTGNLWGQLLTWGLSLAPMAATYLYNKRQGSRRFNVSPAPSQSLSIERYGEEKLQKRVSERLDKAVPPMETGEEDRFVEDTKKMLDRREADIIALEALNVPSYRVNAPAEISLGRAAWNVPPSRRFTPHGTPNPNRRYAYDHQPGGPDTEDKRRIRRAVKAMPLDQLDEAIRRGDVTHVDILNMICDHPASQDGAVMPRPLTGKLRRKLLKLAREADETGVIRHFVAVKDLFPGVDGVVTAGSKTTYFEDLGKSPLVQKILETDIPIPCGLTAGANGGSGLYNAHGAVGNPRMPGHDSAGSSSACAYLLGLDDMPIRLAVGTDTGGSISAPCGAAGLFGWVPEKGLLSTVNMIPFATHLDTPGVLGVDRDEVLRFVKQITVKAYQNHYQAPTEAPEVYYFETDLTQVSEDSQNNFQRRLDGFRTKGFTVTALDQRFSAIRSIPLDLYLDSYVAAAFTLMNPLEDNWIEPQRYILDRNLQNRLAKANALLKAKDDKHGNLFNRFLDLHVRFRNLVHNKFPKASVFATPTPEAVALDDFKPNGAAGAKLDSHDILGGMLKNRTDRALFVDRDNRIVVEGRTRDVLAVSQGYNATSVQRKVAEEAVERYPMLAEPQFQPVVALLAKNTVGNWQSEGGRLEADDLSDRRIPEPYLEKNLVEFFTALQGAGKKNVLDALKQNGQGNRARRAQKGQSERPQVAA